MSTGDDAKRGAENSPANWSIPHPDPKERVVAGASCEP